MVRGMALRLSEVKAALAASRPRCVVYANSYCEHVMQLYAGLYVLRLEGSIHLDQKFGRGSLNYRLGEALAARFASKPLPALLLDVEGAGLVLFDLRDGGNFYDEALDQVALYVKRSYRRGLYGRHAHKFIPMGLNYLLYLERTTALYPNCLAPAGVRTQRMDYLKLLRQFAVCVATTGYFDSIGWKFAEYTALGKAIACEPLRFELPGPIAPGANYLEFSTPEQCADRVAELFGSGAMRREMGQRNRAYFEGFGRPEAA